MFAVINMHADVAGELLEHGADVNATANDGATALMLAASSGDTASVRALIRKGADPSGRYIRTGETALMLAKKKNHDEHRQFTFDQSDTECKRSLKRGSNAAVKRSVASRSCPAKKAAATRKK